MFNGDGVKILLIALRPLPVRFDLMLAFSDGNTSTPHKDVIPKSHLLRPIVCPADLPSFHLLWLSLSRYPVPSPGPRILTPCFILLLSFLLFLLFDQLLLCTQVCHCTMLLFLLLMLQAETPDQ